MSDAPIRIGHPDDGFEADICGCCEGTELATLRPTANRPNLSAIAFRAGDHGRFKASMLTGLASAAYPALRGLGTREDDDFSIALIDAWASACDVLTFYQERLANEAYMGTATERLSVGELARLIGYRLHPGAAAETDLVILMEDPPAAEADVTNLLVPEGTRVQSQPGPDEMPQVFETIEDLETRVGWNVLLPRLSQDILPGNFATSTWLEGSPALQVGDRIVFIGRERSDITLPLAQQNPDRWDIRTVTAVLPNATLNRTLITWDSGLENVSDPASEPLTGLQLFHLRDRASFFGFNAPHPRVLTAVQRVEFGYQPTGPIIVIPVPGEDPPEFFSPSRIMGSADDYGDWDFRQPATGLIALDAAYKSFVPGSWTVLVSATGVAQLYRITVTETDAEARYAISGKTTRLTLDTSVGLSNFNDDEYRRTSVLGGSVRLPLAETPLVAPITGSEVVLDSVADLPEDRRLIFRGRRARLRVVAEGHVVQPEEGEGYALSLGEFVVLLADPMDLPGTFNKLFRFEAPDRTHGSVIASEFAFEAIAAGEETEEIAETVVLNRVDPDTAYRSKLVLSEALQYAYDRESLRIHANVARAAHGEGVTDILGSGDPSQPFQKFLLKQAPVTHRVAPTETGIESTLSLRVDGAAWEEVPDLYQRGPAERVYKTSLTDDGQTIVEFGDGISGARPLAGRDNIVAEHSKGIGLAGNLRAGQLILPLDRPLGLKETLNPLPATGGDDAERQEDARRNAPIYTLTLGRVVSLTDYRDFALGFPGIAKAEARWVWQGETRRIVVTVAGPGGAEIPEGSTTFDNLLAAFRSLGDPLVGVDLLSYAPAYFRLGLRVAVDADYDADAVLPATEAAFRAAFSFEERDFGQLLALSEVAAAAHGVAGVSAVDVDLLYREQAPQTLQIAHARLISQQGRQGVSDAVLPAEILMLSPGPLDKLEVMS